MNVDTMRKVDYYLGVPLCFLGTLATKFCSLFSSGDYRGKPKNVLCIGLSEMGSTILADPAMMKIKTELRANLFFAIFCRNRPTLHLLNTVPPENIFCIRDSGLFALTTDTVRFFLWTRRNRIDAVIDLELFSRFTALLTGFSGAMRRAGFHIFHGEGLYRGNFLTHKVAYNPHQHMARNYVALANALLSDNAEVPYSKTVISDSEISPQKVPVSEDAIQGMVQKIKAAFPAFDAGRQTVVLFNTDSSDLVPLRRWPRDYYIRLAKMLIDRHARVVILLTGDEGERKQKDDIVKAVNSDRCVNFAGQTAVTDLPALYSLSSFMLTNDSGPAHFASLTDMPTFVIFGPETPALYGPLGASTPIYSGLACSPCVSAINHRKSPCNDNVCLRLLTPERVYQTLLPALEE